MSDNTIYTALGVISGTSMDGIDVAVIETDGNKVFRHIAGQTMSYPRSLAAELRGFLRAPERAETESLEELEAGVTEAFSVAIETFLQTNHMAAEQLDLIGLHGQTVWHCPERRFTRQLGRGQDLATHFGVKVIDHFRHADVAAGGQGAPFAPLYHRALAANLPQPLVMLNLGGVGNVTYIDHELVLAFDTGPASAMIDDYVQRHFDVPFDEGGKIAASGKVDQTILENFLSDPYFDLKPPKSLDRQHFHALMDRVGEMGNPRDAVATLAACTIAATAAANRHLPKPAHQWLVCGGGRHNGEFLRGLQSELGIPVAPSEQAGWDGDIVEAECFAFLAVRSLLGLPLSLPTTTGVPEPMRGGMLHEPLTDR